MARKTGPVLAHQSLELRCLPGRLRAFFPARGGWIGANDDSVETKLMLCLRPAAIDSISTHG